MNLRASSLCLACTAALAASGCVTKKSPEEIERAAMAPATIQEGKKPKLPLSLAIAQVLSYPARLFPSKKSKTPKATEAITVGEVKMVNDEDRFVLIDGRSYYSFLPGDSLICVSNQQQTAVLRLTNLRNPPYLIADILSGSPSAGDRIYPAPKAGTH